MNFIPVQYPRKLYWEPVPEVTPVSVPPPVKLSTKPVKSKPKPVDIQVPSTGPKFIPFPRKWAS